MVGVDKFLTQDKYHEALEDDIDLDKKIVKLDEFNELASEDLVIPIRTSSAEEKVAFGLMRNAKTLEFLNKN